MRQPGSMHDPIAQTQGVVVQCPESFQRQFQVDAVGKDGQAGAERVGGYGQDQFIEQPFLGKKLVDLGAADNHGLRISLVRQIGENRLGRIRREDQVRRIRAPRRIARHHNGLTAGEDTSDDVESGRPHDHHPCFFGDLDIEALVGFAGPIGIVVSGSGNLAIHGNGDHQNDMHGNSSCGMRWR
ncbi:hypothetical protein DESC_190091 [Desulfosarcina cetonica]|nr:hypothetical protein DESC_190091 [Desulfosarcina cetonica]